MRPQPSRASAEAAAGVIAAGTKRKSVSERGGPPPEVGPKEADIREDIEKVAKWVEEHGRLPKRPGRDATEAQREECKEETRLAIFLNGQRAWISGSERRVEPHPDDRRRLLQAVPLLAERLREWDEMREKRG